MLPDNLHLGPVHVHWFGLMMALAFFAAGTVVGREFKRSGFNAGTGWGSFLWGSFGGIVGARVWVIGENLSAFLRDPVHLLLSGGGLAWYGGLAGGALALTLFLRSQSIPWLAGANALAPAIAIGQAIGRIGCQLSGDGDWGTETTLPWGMAYPHAIVGWDKPLGVRVHPTPLYEFAAYLIVFAILIAMRRRGAPRGATLGAYLALSGLARFLVEFVRINPRVLLGLTVAQLVSLVLVLIGGWLLATARQHGPVDGDKGLRHSVVPRGQALG
jgi:phosphatidylglycerol:prolipoprotein diacylglycerol transferase